MKTTVSEKLSAALRAFGIRPFTCQSSYQDCDAKSNLRGRTHYVDDDTLKSFQARILDAGMWAKGCKPYECSDSLIYWIVESVNSRPGHGGYNKQFVAFDVFGTVLTRSALDDESWFKTTEQARKAGLAALEKLNPVKHTTNELKARCKRQIAEARETLATLRRKPATA